MFEGGFKMSLQMHAAVLTEPGTVEVQQVPVPTLKYGEALIRVSCCGVCGSDVGMVYGRAHKYPLILGHEFSGIVTEVAGEQGRELVGKTVTAAPLLSCGQCAACRSGRPQACKSYLFMGSGTDGAMAEYVKVPVDHILSLEGLTAEEGALIEPITIAIHAVKRVQPDCLSKTVVLGGGPIGLLTAMVAKILGANKVILLDVDERRVEFARSLGIEAINNATCSPEANGAGGATAVFECAAAQASLRSAFALADYGGTVVLIAITKKDVVLTPEDLHLVLKKELLVTGAWLSCYVPWLDNDDWRLARRLLKEHRIQAAKLVTTWGTIDDSPAILEQQHRNPGANIKTMILCSDEGEKTTGKLSVLADTQNTRTCLQPI